MKPEFDIDKSFRQCVGIDISKDKFSACLYMQNAEGSNCRSPFVEFANTKTGFNQLMKWTRKECMKDHAIGFLMEATGNLLRAIGIPPPEAQADSLCGASQQGKEVCRV